MRSIRNRKEKRPRNERGQWGEKVPKNKDGGGKTGGLQKSLCFREEEIATKNAASGGIRRLEVDGTDAKKRQLKKYPLLHCEKEKQAQKEEAREGPAQRKKKRRGGRRKALRKADACPLIKASSKGQWIWGGKPRSGHRRIVGGEKKK